MNASERKTTIQQRALCTLLLTAGLMGNFAGARKTDAAETLLGFWAVGFGEPGISTELSLFNDRPAHMGVGITIVDDAQQSIAGASAGLTPFQRKHFDLEAIVASTRASVGFFVVTGSSPTPGILSGSVITGLDPGGAVDGKARLLLDPDGNVISSAQALTGQTLARAATDTLLAPLGLTTLAPTPGEGFQTFLMFANVGTDPLQAVQVEFFGDNEISLGDCSFVLTAFDLVVTRPGIPDLGDTCPVDLAPALVAPSGTTARWAARIRTVPSSKVLIGQVVVVNTLSREAFAFPMQ